MCRQGFEIAKHHTRSDTNLSLSPVKLEAIASHTTGTAPLAVPALDTEREIDRISAILRRQVADECKRRGLIVAMSGGVDSSVCAGLAVRALGPKRVYGIFMPERDSDPASLELLWQYDTAG